MNGEGGQDRDRARHLMMAELDGELSGAERQELERLLAGDPELRAEQDRLRRVKEVTNNMKLKNPPEEVWSNYWVSVYNRVERGIGWVLFSLGVVALLIYGSWQAVNEMLDDPTIPGLVKVAVFALVAGGLVLLFSVVREKLFVRKRDPYKEVER